MKLKILTILTLSLSACDPSQLSAQPPLTQPPPTTTPSTSAQGTTNTTSQACVGVNGLFPAISTSTPIGTYYLWECTNNCSQVPFMSVAILLRSTDGTPGWVYNRVIAITATQLHLSGSQTSFVLSGNEIPAPIDSSGNSTFGTNTYPVEVSCDTLTINGATFTYDLTQTP